jgi:sugar-specific transcriptional regulator TrmB
MKKIVEYLEELQFSEIEAKLYLSLLKNGPLTVAELAKVTGINRSAAYSHISSLIEKGVIAEVKKQSSKKLVANDPEQLKYLIEDKLASVKALERRFPDILRTINVSLAQSKQEEKVDVKYYEGRKGIEHIISEVLKTKSLRVYANLAESANFFLPSEFDIYERALVRNKSLKIYELVGDSPNIANQYNLDGTAKTGRYHYKFLPADIDLMGVTFIYDNKVAILNVKNEPWGVIFHNTDYYNNSKKLFDFMWKMLPNPHTSV